VKRLRGGGTLWSVCGGRLRVPVTNGVQALPLLASAGMAFFIALVVGLWMFPGGAESGWKREGQGKRGMAWFAGCA